MTEIVSKIKDSFSLVSAHGGPLIIAEISANHGGTLKGAIDLIDAIAQSGVDAIKFQTYTPDSMTIQSDRSEFTIRNGPWCGRTLYDLYNEAHTPYEWHPALFNRVRHHGLLPLSTPFDFTAVDLLEKCKISAYKIASFEINDLPLIAKAAKSGKPIIISTGMASFEEISEAVKTARGNGSSEVVLLHCISNYPALEEDAHILQMQNLALNFRCPVGLSDHTISANAALVATALGACIIEKHVTLSRDTGGPDSHFSLEPNEMTDLVSKVRSFSRILGKPGFERPLSEHESRQFRRSLYIMNNVLEGHIITPKDIRSIRPGDGLSPAYYDSVIGSIATKNLIKGTPLIHSDFRRS